jgi:hypothetical protein
LRALGALAVDDLRIPAIAITHSDASRSGIPIDRDQCGAGSDGTVGWLS